MARRGATKRPPATVDVPAPGLAPDPLLVALEGASPRDFVAVRNKVVAELKAAGRAAESARVRLLRRPAPSVWAVNALARTQPEAVAALLRLGERVRADEAQLIAGGDGRAFMEQARSLRQQSAQLGRKAEALAKAAGVGIDSPAARRIAQTLQAAATGDEATRAAFAVGRLAADLAVTSSFGGDLSSALAASVGGKAARPLHRHAPGLPQSGAAVREHASAPTGSGRPRADNSSERSVAVDRSSQPAREHTDAAAATAARARRRAEVAAARALAAAQRRAEAVARKRVAADRRRLASAEHETAACRRDVERARATVEKAEGRLQKAKAALAAAVLSVEAARRKLAGSS